MSPAPHILIADGARGNGVQNFGLRVQNCTKWVQNYDPISYVETAFGGLHVTSPPPYLNCRLRKMEWCTKFATQCTKLYKIMIYFSFSKSVFGGAGDMYLLKTTPGGSRSVRFTNTIEPGGQNCSIVSIIYSRNSRKSKMFNQNF